jgi:hypothetical protein
MTREEIDEIAETIREALNARILTREELAREVSKRVGAKIGGRLLHSWGVFLKPAAYKGYLCFGPSKGRNVTFTRPDQWLNVSLAKGDEGLGQVLRRFLSTYGPATHEDFARWWGTDYLSARRLIMSVRRELDEVSVEGRTAWVCNKDREEMQAVEITRSVNLLPSFDCYLLGYYPRESLVSSNLATRVFRQAGWVSPVLLVDGRAMGVWDLKKWKNDVKVRVKLFAPITGNNKRVVREEATRLDEFLGMKTQVSYSQ